MISRKMIARKTAEAARRAAQNIETAQAGCLGWRESERRALVKIWNEFCSQETARLDAKPLRINPTVALFGG